MFYSIPITSSHGAGESTNLAGICQIVLMYASMQHIHTWVYMFMHDVLLFNIVMMTAYASRAWKAKSSLGETYPGASSWFSSFDQWTCWRQRVSYLSMSYLFKLVNPFFCTNLRGAKISRMYLEILVQQCHKLWLFVYFTLFF